MRRHVVAWSCLLALALALHAGCRSSSGRTGSLAGTVQETATRTPIGDAEVTVGAATARTDARGHFTIDELEVGDRPATVTAPGYKTLTETVTIESGENTVVLELRPVGSIDGGLMDGPVGDAPVQFDAGQHDAAQSDAAACAGNYCTYGYAYGECCASAPYCANYYGASSLVCRATCGATNERCGYHSDCCDGNCVSGYCAAPSCAGNSCSYGYYYGGCCDTAQYCVNYYGASSLVCRATCGNTNERCAYSSDCCSNNCVSGYCAAASCTGSTCTYGYIDYGGCCSTAQYCTNPNGYSYMSCRATCGNTNERCYSNGDCCNGLTCASGYCVAPSCTGNACTYGYAYGQCCAAQPYCVNSYGSSSLMCRATCGATYERCGYNTDCCNGTCAYNSTYSQVLCN